MVIDLFGLQEAEVRQRFPDVYQWVLERVKPERDQNNRASYGKPGGYSASREPNFAPPWPGSINSS